MKPKVQSSNGKGCKWRKNFNFKKYKQNFDKINWKSKTAKETINYNSI